MAELDQERVAECLQECSEEARAVFAALADWIRLELQVKQGERNPDKAKAYWGPKATQELVGALLRRKFIGNGGMFSDKKITADVPK